MTLCYTQSTRCRLYHAVLFYGAFLHYLTYSDQQQFDTCLQTRRRDPAVVDESELAALLDGVEVVTRSPTDNQAQDTDLFGDDRVHDD
jgi:hypothetical protein